MLDHDGRVLTARLYGGEDPGIVLLPDGRLGWPDDLTYTDEPFRALSIAELKASLLDREFRGFSALETRHYLVLYRGTQAFAQSSGSLLESLYEGLLGHAQQLGLPAHDPEFPLIAVIYEDEEAFRSANDVAPDVEAFYDIATNRIHLFENAPRDLETPDLAARRKPQTVAHEGCHQVLQNIGVHPRLANWPVWLVEGLAEYFAPTTVRWGDTWDGADRVNPFHMATIRELADPMAGVFVSSGEHRLRIGRSPGVPLVEHIVTRSQLSPTDYALAWALTHFLANTHKAQFRTYLQMLGEREPMGHGHQDEHLIEFRHIFGQDLVRMDRAFGRYLGRLKGAEDLLHFAVLIEQPLNPGVTRRSALVSQSSAMISQWIEENASIQGGPIGWRIMPFPTRSRAVFAARRWMELGH